MNFNTVLYSLDGHVATITLNRPERLNAMTQEMLSEINSALDLAEKDDNVDKPIPAEGVWHHGWTRTRLRRLNRTRETRGRLIP